MSCGIDGALTDRHDHLVLTVADMISAAGFQVALEPKAFNGRHRESGPDLDVMDFYGYPNSVCMDVTIVNPLAASYVERSSREGLATAHQAEVAKVRKYEKSLELSGRLIAGLAMESTGVLGPSLQHVMETCENRHNIRERRGCSLWPVWGLLDCDGVLRLLVTALGGAASPRECGHCFAVTCGCSVCFVDGLVCVAFRVSCDV